MKNPVRYGTLKSNAVRAALYYARKRRLEELAKQEAEEPEPDP